MSTRPTVAPDDEPCAPNDLDAAYCALLDEVAEELREQARSWARRLRLVARVEELSRRAPSGSVQFLQLEAAGSWQVGQLTATRWLWESERMHDALPRTLAMLDDGDLLVHQATVLLHRTRHCTPQVARAVEDRLLPAGAALVPSDLTRRVDRAVLQVESEQADATAAEQRHADAAAERHTFAKPLPDAMGLAGAVLTAEQLTAWQAGLDTLERRERMADLAHGVDRTAQQRRADLFAALPAMVLAGTAQDRAALERAGLEQAGHTAPDRAGDQAGPRCTDAAGLRPWTLGPEQLAAQVVLNVHVPVSTVLDLSSAPGSLDRYGPVSAEHVRLLRPHSWRRVMVDARSGRPLAVDDRTSPVPDVVTERDEPQHDPSARLARLVDVRDVHCCGPGCAATRTHRDHLDPYPHGPTSAANLGRLSARCHRAKHAGWTLVRHLDGSTTWTSPVGRTYDRPSPHAAPPHVDLTADLPPLRPRPRPVATTHLDTPDLDTPGLDTTAPRPGVDDEGESEVDRQHLPPGDDTDLHDPDIHDTDIHDTDIHDTDIHDAEDDDPPPF